jgi:K+-sensing histidine kinase KdpD
MSVEAPPAPPRRLIEKRKGRVSGLREFVTPTLEAVERRRAQLWMLAAFVLVALAGGMVILTMEHTPLRQIQFLPLNALRLLFVGFIATIALYLIDKELKLRSLTRSLVDERVLSAALSNRLRELSALSEVGKAINRLLDIDDVLRRILQAALDLLEGDEGSIMLLDAAGEYLKVAHAFTTAQEVVDGAVVKVGEGVAGWVAQNKEPLLLAGKVPDDMFDRLEKKQRDIPYAVSVPLVVNDELYGVLNVNAGPTRQLSEYDLRALQLFAEHAAIAIRNARSFERERQTVVRLEEIDRLKDEFLASVSHELKTPLTSIIGSAKTMRLRRERLSEEQREDFLNVIERQAVRLLKMVEQLLSAAQLESGKPNFKREEIDVGLLARQVVQGFEAAGGKNQIWVEGPDHMRLFADPSIVEQVMTNLVENALKYSDGGGEVTLRLLEAPAEVYIEVVDKGRGIPSVEIPNIFDRFKQLDQSATGKRSGVGLGLYIVKNLVEASGGAISVKSEFGKGSTFKVTLPKRRDAIVGDAK